MEDPNPRRIAKVAPLLALELDAKKNIKEKGCYCLSSNNHAVAFLNLDFGAYLVDPNYGLFRWDAIRQKDYRNFTQAYSFKPLVKLPTSAAA